MTRSSFNNIIYLLLSLMIISLYTSHTQAILSISEPIALLLTIIGIYLYKDVKITDSFKKVFVKKDILTSVLFLFIIWSLIVSIFLSYQPKLSAYRSFRDFRDPLAFTIISLSLIYTDTRYRNWLLNLIVIISAISIITLFISILFNYQGIQTIARGYTRHLNIIAPFLMINILSKNKLKSLFTILLTGMLLFIFFYQMSRGSLLGLVIEIGIITLFYFYKSQASYKIKFLQIGILITVFSLMGLGFFKTKTGVFTRINLHQGISSSGRDVIISTRLPIFLKYGSITHGIGSDYGAYVNFFTEHNAPKKFGAFNKKENKFLYWRDEPQILQVFYESGIIGVSLYLIFLISFAIKLFISGIKQGDNSYIAIPIFTALIGDSFVKALFENTGISTPIFLCAIWLILDQASKIKLRNLNMREKEPLVN